VSERLRFLIRTPHESVVNSEVRAARVPAETGLVGLRPRQEPVLFVVEPGLVVLREDSGTRYAATAGGLLHCERELCILSTPFAVAGKDEADVLAALKRALAAPNSELAVRRQLAELEQRIVQELGQRMPAAPARVGHG